MGTANINVYGRDYSIACDDGQEEHLGKLTHMVNNRVQELLKEMGRAPEHTMLIYTALMLADELLDVTKAYKRLDDSVKASGGAAAQPVADTSGDVDEALSASMEQIAGRIEKLAEQLELAA